MKENEFKRIQSKLEKFKFSSLNYSEYCEVEDFKIENEDDDLILISGYNAEAKVSEYHYAANDYNNLLNRLDLTKEFLITFIPHEWIKKFEERGIKVRNAWHDYFIKDLSSVPINDNYELLKLEECKEASDVTMSCRGQSRGFTGQTEKWIKSWLNGTEYGCINSEIEDSTIIVSRNSENKIVGIICTGTYAHKSVEGATVWIREIAVQPEYQNKGIARRLINQAITYGKKNGAKRGFLAADECNDTAIHLYKSIGFKPSDEESEIDMINEK